MNEDSFVLWLIEKKKQEILKKDAMIEWLARELADRTEVCPDCPAYIGERCMEPTKRCYKAWITAAEKMVQDADGVDSNLQQEHGEKRC